MVPAGRAALAAGLCAAMGVVIGRTGVLASEHALVGIVLGAAALVLTIFVESLRGGHGPVLRQELGDLREEVRLLRGQIVEIEALILIAKSSTDAVLRRSDPGRFG